MGIIKRLLGINELLQKVNEIDNKLNLKEEIYCDKKDINIDKSTSLQFFDPIDKKEFLSIESNVNDNYSNLNLRPIGDSARVLAMLQNMPLLQTINQSKQLKGAYKVVFPEGAVGKLMKYKNGMFGTPLVQPNNKIGNTHAGLVPIESMPLNPVIVFTALSAITGQYFMAKIDSALEEISKGVKDVITMLLDDKESRNGSIFYFIVDVKENLDLILNNSDKKLATLTNLQSSLIDLKQNKIFYEKRINRKKDELRTILNSCTRTSKSIEEIEKFQNEVSDLFMQHHICVELYVIGKIYEMQLSQMYDEDYCNKLASELYRCIGVEAIFNKKVSDEFMQLIDKIEAKAIINKDMIGIQRQLVEKNMIKKQESFTKKVQVVVDSIKDIIELNKKDAIFIVKNDKVYYVESKAA